MVYGQSIPVMSACAWTKAVVVASLSLPLPPQCPSAQSCLCTRRAAPPCLARLLAPSSHSDYLSLTANLPHSLTLIEGGVPETRRVVLSVQQGGGRQGGERWVGGRRGTDGGAGTGDWRKEGCWQGSRGWVGGRRRGCRQGGGR
eukprot:356872-Chlamydomonas_euryale.AAC.6